MGKLSPERSGNESEEVPPPSADSKAKTSDEPMDVDNEEGSGGEGEEEYEIEAILDAKRGSFPNGRMGYFVKWKGYGEEENSWVDEMDAGNAHALIDEYWKNHPNKRKGPRKSTDAKTPRRSRKSGIDEGSDGGSSKKRGKKTQAKADSDLENDKEGMDIDGSKAAKKSRKSAAAKTQAKDTIQITVEGDGIIIGDMSEYMKVSNWEDLVATVDTIEREKDSSLTVYFSLKSGERVKENSRICAERFPQKIIQFYESNLRWRSADSDDES